MNYAKVWKIYSNMIHCDYYGYLPNLESGNIQKNVVQLKKCRLEDPDECHQGWQLIKAKLMDIITETISNKGGHKQLWGFCS